MLIVSVISVLGQIQASVARNLQFSSFLPTEPKAKGKSTRPANHLRFLGMVLKRSTFNEQKPSQKSGPKNTPTAPGCNLSGGNAAFLWERMSQKLMGVNLGERRPDLVSYRMGCTLGSGTVHPAAVPKQPWGQKMIFPYCVQLELFNQLYKMRGYLIQLILSSFLFYLHTLKRCK